MQSLLLTIANDKSAKEDLTKALNKFNMKAKTIELDKTHLFAKILNNTDSTYTQTKENDEDTTWNGNEKHDNGLANEPRDGYSRIQIHIIVHKQNHRIIYTYFVRNFSSKLDVSSRYPVAKCRRDALMYSKQGA